MLPWPDVLVTQPNPGVFCEHSWMPGCRMQFLPLGSSSSTEAATGKAAAEWVQSGGADALSDGGRDKPNERLKWWHWWPFPRELSQNGETFRWHILEFGLIWLWKHGSIDSFKQLSIGWIHLCKLAHLFVRVLPHPPVFLEGELYTVPAVTCVTEVS